MRLSPPRKWLAVKYQLIYIFKLIFKFTVRTKPRLHQYGLAVAMVDRESESKGLATPPTQFATCV